MDISGFYSSLPFPVEVLFLIIAWELFWKGLALWKAAQLKSAVWFVLILVLNTLGILPIIYLLATKGSKPIKDMPKKIYKKKSRK